MEKYLSSKYKHTKSLVLTIAILGTVICILNVAASTQPSFPTSYNGYVRIADNGSPMPNTSITVLAGGIVLASATSDPDAYYLINVPWDDLSTTQDEGVMAGEIITFQAADITVTSRVIGEQGFSNKINLDVPSITTPDDTSGGTSSGDSGTFSGGTSGVRDSSSSELLSNIFKTETRNNVLVAGKPVTYKFTVPELDIYQIDATGKENENSISIKVDRLNGVSSLVKEAAPGTVYHYINIWAGTKRLQKGLIKFKVENSWIASKSASNGEVKMLKWDSSKWIIIPTAEVSKDTTNTYYEAQIESFSPFAISIVKEVAPETELPGVTVRETAAITPKATLEAKPTARTPAVSPGITTAVVVLVAIFMTLRKKGGK